jgi:lipopolysaccharide transport system ATP-binding protein
MKKPIIQATGIGKKYKITHQRGGYIALRDVLANIFSNPFKFVFHKTRQIVGLEKKEEFWALKDINFSVEKGEVIGIIGRNGAGKSTLLKILSQITPPTTGEVRINGTMGSLLEVGTGFHPELSGRENIMLNGAILGMPKKEIAQKFDAIVNFAGIDKFIDTPVKYYSSGMYVRLAFSVAAHMEPDILLVDEVLAVGDAEFQKKCLGKMDEITKKDGRTILFVSHNMAAVKSLCHKCMLLKDGRIESWGDTAEIIDKYLSNQSTATIIPVAEQKRISKATLRAKIIDVRAEQPDTNDQFNFRDNLPFNIKLIVESYHDNLEPSAQIIISDEYQNLVFADSASMSKKFFKLRRGLNEITCRFNSLNLFSGNYKISCYLTIPHIEIMDYVKDAYSFNIVNFDPYGRGGNVKKDEGNGIFYIDHSWDFKS